MKLSKLQLLVAQHYAGGEFVHVVNTDQLDHLGDTLFKFAILEAGDAADEHEYCTMLGTAIDQMRSLQDEITETT